MVFVLVSMRSAGKVQSRGHDSSNKHIETDMCQVALTYVKCQITYDVLQRLYYIVAPAKVIRHMSSCKDMK